MVVRQVYLSYDEYLAYTTAENVVEADKFVRLSRAAENALDGVTNAFYKYHLMTDDSYCSNNFEFDWLPNNTEFEAVSIRAEFFKKAMTALVDYYNYQQGATNSYQISDATTVQIGRTSVTNGNKNSGSTINKILPPEVLYLLGLGGFLYKGVATTCW